MRIGLDARSLTVPNPRGTGRNLLDAYQRVPTLHPEWEFVLYHQHPLTPAATPDGPRPWQHANVRLRHIDIPGDRFGAWLQLRLPLAACRDHVNLMHFPANAAPAWCPVPFVTTVHDLAPLHVAGELLPREAELFRRGVQRAVTRSAHIITPSAATRDDLCRTFAVTPDKITVIPWAADTRIAQQAQRPLADSDRRQLRQQYNLGPCWLVSFAGVSRRKNARGVLDGFARVPWEIRHGVQVVLVGCNREDFRNSLAADAERHGISGQVRILDFVPYEDLPTLLRGARGLLMPSRCEGFGLPILDAFACGVPVLTANVSSMPEIAGDAALYCDPNDPCSIAAGIEQLLDDAVAAQLVPRGFNRLSQFTWQRTAEAMCSVYEKCLYQRRGGPAPVAMESCPR